MSSSNILQVPFRRTHATQLSDAIKVQIGNKFDQHPDLFTRDLEIVDQLRKDAVNALEPHSSGIKKLQAYAAQLVWLGGKFPVDMGANFTWYPSLGYDTNRSHTENNIRFELANVLFNLAAMYSQIGLASNRATQDGLKSAANNFCFAAGVFRHLKEQVIPDMKTVPPEDMDTVTVEALEALMLAQAQECFWQKAVKDGMKDAIIAKLAAKVSDLYSDANEWSLKTNNIRSEWIHHMNAKHHHFAAAAQYRAACDCLEKRKYGEEVARLRDSLTCVSIAMNEAKWINKMVIADLNGLKTRVSEDFKRAEKDNDTIYLIPEPSKSELRPLDRASMVQSRVPKEVSNSQEMLGEKSELGKPLFSKLVPYAVHVAASIYSDRRDRLVNNSIIAELDALTLRIHELLSSLNLPGSLQALEKPLGLPPALASHADEVRQFGGVHRLHSTIADTGKLKANNRALYQEGIDLLRTEASEDEAARRKYGTDRWARPTGAEAGKKLYDQINAIDGWLKAADTTDRTVLNRLHENESLIRLLGGSNRDLEDYVPSSRRATMTAKVEREANALRATLNEVSRLESRRRKKVEALRVKVKEDDVQPELRAESHKLEREFPMMPIQASQFENLFDERLKRYDIDQSSLKTEEREQDALLQRVKDANQSFQNAKRGDSSSKEREEALQNLENAYAAYKEILKNLEVGRKFYNDLSGITMKFRDECRTFFAQRRSEASNLETDVSDALAGLQLQQSTQANLLQERAAEAASRRGSVQPHAIEDAILAAPIPQRVSAQPPPVANVKSPVNSGPPPPPPANQTWNENMPIVFGGAGASGAGPGHQGKGGQQTWDPSKGLQFAKK